jgi:hypothetical protein
MILFPTLAVEVLWMVIFEVLMEFEQQLKELEHRRKRGMRLLADGVEIDSNQKAVPSHIPITMQLSIYPA